jgi:hypothetical protein
VPALPVVPNVIRCDLAWAIEGDPLAVTRSYFSYINGPPSNADLTAFAAALQAECATVFTSLMADSVSLTSITLTDLSSASGAIGSNETAIVGTRGTELLPPGACAVAHYPITRRYRGGKPRNYWPFGASQDVATSGLWVPLAVTAFQNAIQAFFRVLLGTTQGTTTITHHVNVSYYSGFTSVQNPITHRWRNVPTLRAAPVVDIITEDSELVGSFIGSQRRRNRAA